MEDSTDDETVPDDELMPVDMEIDESTDDDVQFLFHRDAPALPPTPRLRRRPELNAAAITTTVNAPANSDEEYEAVLEQDSNWTPGRTPPTVFHESAPAFGDKF